MINRQRHKTKSNGHSRRKSQSKNGLCRPAHHANAETTAEQEQHPPGGFVPPVRENVIEAIKLIENGWF